ncbi:MAG: hypothetical protein K0R28_2873, partial [Paenibacillus sp.]|nr:hypothetical protein [Paenibacillus sp.]
MHIKKKWITSAAIVLISVLLSSILLFPSSNLVYADEAITYNTASWVNGQFSKYKNLTSNEIFLSRPGYKIKEAFIMNGETVVQEVEAAKGQLSWNGTVTVEGMDTPVRSINNATAQGYYAWFRYSKADGRKDWYANFERLDSSYNKFGEQRTCPNLAENPLTSPPPMDDTGMYAYPGCDDDALFLSGALLNEFKTTENLEISRNAVDISNAVGSATEDVFAQVSGPADLYPDVVYGNTDPSTIPSNVLIKSDASEFTVQFYQNFNNDSGYSKPLPAYGAKVMVYFAAFRVNINAMTYKFPPYKLRVTYEEVDSSKPDLLPDGITTTGSVKLDELKTYTVTFKNLGTPITNTPFRVIVKHISSGSTVFDKHFSSISKEQIITDTFTYAATNPQKLRFGLYVDYGTGKGAIDEGESGGELNNYAEYEFPVNIGIDGDFDLVPSTIRYTDDFQVVPKNFEIPSSCTYRYHQYRFIQNGVTWTTNNVNGRTTTTSFLYPSYPDNLSIGTSMVALQIYTDCGNTGWINEKPLTVQPSDTPNTPPEFRAGFFLENNRTGTDPVSKVILGSHVNLRIIDDPSSTPPSPYDEEKDYPITWNWDFAGSTTSWIQGLPAKYGFDRRDDHFYNIKADELGNFSIRVTGTDRRGEATSRMVFLNVIPPNPIAWCSAPSPVKANRPVDQSKFLSTYSYSPSGSTINHSRNEWVNKQTSYSNLTDSDLTVMVQLWVYDSGGLKSLAPANCPIVVKPDQPPVGKLDVPPLGLRGHTYELFNKSYSPDSDVLTSAAYRFKYDAANNGFHDDGWQWLGGTIEKASFSPNRVGKY